MKASDLFIKALENEGVEYIFGIPGEENLDLLESIRNSKQIKLILCRQEQAAGFMAAVYGRLTGKVGVCMSTLGPGATNLVTAAAYATLGGMPMLMITGQKPIKKSKQGNFQVIDAIEMMMPLTKYSKQIVNVNRIPSRIREAFRKAIAERPGAVHLELPEDIARETAEETFLFPVKHIRRPLAGDNAIKTAKEMIEKAKRPLILVGAGSNRKLVQNAFIGFIQKTGIPFINTQMGKGMSRGAHDYFIGTAALSDNDYVHLAINQADLIINIGHDIIEKPPFFMKHEGQEVIHVNFFPAEIDNVYFPQHEVVGDIERALERMTDLVEKQNSWDFSFYYKIQKAIKNDLTEKINDNSFPLLPQRIVSDTRKVLSEDSILCLDNGMYKIWFARNYLSFGHNTILLDNALATMGAGLPSAIAAKLVNPDKKIVAICGDGGFMMNSQELETAIRLKLDLTIVIITDNAYGMIKWKQAGMGFEDFGLDYGNPDFVKYAESYGAKGYRVEKAEDYAKLLEKCINEKGVNIIELPVDYSENVKFLAENLKKNIKV